MLSGNKILLKRSNDSGRTPVLSSLDLGELGLNTIDGRIFAKTFNGSVSSIVSFLNSDDYPYTLNHYYSSVNFNYGNNTVSQIYASVLGGYNNDISGGGSSVINGEDNDIAGDFSLIGSGLKNKINASGDYSFIAAGSGNLINHSNVFTLGSNLSSHASNFTYVNNISAQGVLYGDGSGLTNLATSPAPDTGVRALTANWQSTYAQVSSLSANWGSTESGTLTYELSVVDTTQGLYKNGDLIPVGTSIENILINMLKTSVPPTYTSPTLSVAYGSPTVVTTYEVGDTISSFTITPTFNANDSGGSTGFVYFKDASNLGTGSSKVVSSFQINSSTTLQVSAGYSQGAIKNDNLGNPYPSGRINAGSTTSTATLNVLYPYFWGKSNTLPTAASIASDIQNGLANKVLASASGTVSVTYNASGEYIWFAHTAAQTEKTKWYVTALNSGSIGNGQAINSPATQNVTSPDAYWSGVSFKIYISSGQQATTGAFEYRNS